MTKPTKKAEKSNRLLQETSPYLRQHAYNPVDWYPWGAEALETAKRLKKPIFLSVGYSACHWCHVMEHESFDNPDIAKLMNENFVCIKVDREERPDLDHIYMNIVQLMTGRGGWPMSVFLSPDQKPIFAGTYFPPDDHHGMPGFPRVLEEVARIYRENPPALQEQTEKLLTVLKNLSRPRVGTQSLETAALREAADGMLSAHDPRFGGFGQAPKFPQTMALGFLLRQFHRTRNAKYLEAVTRSLHKMADGGIYDHLAGGFARYSVDEKWAVPHFEKMLYDNALLSCLYFEAYQVTRDESFRAVGRGVLDWVLDEMTSEDGAFYSSQDADSEGEEGKYYVWNPLEIKKILGPEDGDLFCKHFNVDGEGNFEHGQTVLAIHNPLSTLAKAIRVDERDLASRLEKSRLKLLAVRRKRIAPGRDDKILTSWNALMIRGFVRGFQATGEPKYLEAAKRAATYILKTLTESQRADRLLATAKDGKAKHPAYLDDYAFFTAALLDLFESTGEPLWFQRALAFHGSVLERFGDRESLGFYFTADDHEALIDRPKTFYDGSIPSGNSVVLENALRLSSLTGRAGEQEILEKTLRGLFEAAVEGPMGMANLLMVADSFLQPRRQVVVVAGKDGAEFRAMQRTLLEAYLPDVSWLWLGGSKRVSSAEAPEISDLVQGKEAQGGKTTVYLCEGKTCRPPMTELAAVKKELGL